jgi:hypothetical protein
MNSKVRKVSEHVTLWYFTNLYFLVKMFTVCTNGPPRFDEKNGSGILYSWQTTFGMFLDALNLIISRRNSVFFA